LYDSSSRLGRSKPPSFASAHGKRVSEDRQPRDEFSTRRHILELSIRRGTIADRAIARGDPDEARQTMVCHIRNGIARLFDE
jgi:hypothetical protein